MVVVSILSHDPSLLALLMAPVGIIATTSTSLATSVEGYHVGDAYDDDVLLLQLLCRCVFVEPDSFSNSSSVTTAAVAASPTYNYNHRATFQMLPPLPLSCGVMMAPIVLLA
jgi:hypothetical protein